MPLTAAQIIALADEFDRQLDVGGLMVHADNLGVNLANIAPEGTVQERATKFIDYMNRRMPPRDLELLEYFQTNGNARLRAVATELLKPPFFPGDDAHNAVLLGKTAFVARSHLREALREFTAPHQNTTRVLIVRGPEPGGKSYTWEFLRHLAASRTHARAVRLRLRNKGATYMPRQFIEDIFRLLRLDLTALPPQSDDPQLAHVGPLVEAFKGSLADLGRQYWLVIDDLNDAGVTPIIRETALAIAQSVEELRPEKLWVAMLGYNEELDDPDLRHIAQDDAQFPTPALLATHFSVIAHASPAPLTDTRARELADVVFAKFPKLDKEAMTQLTQFVEQVGEKLRTGQQP